MNHEPQPSAAVPLEAAQRIHQKCERYEDAWSGPTRPQLDAFLTDVLEPERSWLLAELLAVEVELRRGAGEQPTEADYRQSFPGVGDANVIAAAFRRCVESAAPKIEGYEIQGVLGRGGMGVVYKARHLRLKRLVALKMILAGDHAGAEHRARFRAEAEMVARLQHPNIAQIFDVGEQDGRPYIAFEFVEGKTLADFAGREPQPARFAAELLEALARAIHYAHQQGIVHRDLKPANVLLSVVSGPLSVAKTDGAPPPSLQRRTANVLLSVVRCPLSVAKTDGAPPPSLQRTTDNGLLTIPKITDFGLAKDLAAPLEHTSTGAILGTPLYMSPEQAEGRRDIGPATDIYSLGAILYVLLTGRPPLQGTSTIETLKMVVSVEPVPPSQLLPHLARDLETICLKCLHKDPARRYETAGALAEDLRRFLHDEPILARASGRIEKSWRWCRRNPAVASLITAVAAALLLGATVAGFFAFEANRRADAEAKARGDAEIEKAAALEQKDRAERISAVATLLRVGLIFENDPGGARALLEDTEAIRVDLRCPAWGFYRNFCRRKVRDLSGHTKEVLSVAWSPDGKTLVSAGLDGIIKLWDVRTGKERATPKAVSRIATVAFSPDGKTLASAGWDRSVQLWDVATLEKEAILTGHAKVVRSVAWSPDGKTLASGSDDRTIYLWDLAARKHRATLKGHERAVNSVAWSPDGKTLASGGGDTNKPGELKLWDVQTGLERATPRVHINKVHAVAWSPDSKTLASADFSSKIQLWDAVRGIPLAVLEGHDRGIFSLAWSADGETLASAAGDKTVKLWDVARRRERACLNGHSLGVRSVAFSPDSKTLASASEDGAVKLWEARGGAERAVWRAHDSLVQALSSSPDGKTLASGSWDRTIKLWDTATGKNTATLRGNYWFWSVAFSPDGKTLASASGDAIGAGEINKPGELELWDVASGQRRKNLTGRASSVQSVAWSPDGKTLASGSADATIKLWDVASGKERATLEGHTRPVLSVTWSPDGKTLASAGQDMTIKLWDVGGGQVRNTLKSHISWITSTAWSPDGKTLASAGWDQTIKLWDVASGKNTSTINAHNSSVTSLAWSLDGKTLASASGDQTIKLWDVASGQVRATLKSSSTITSLAWSTDGKTLVSGEVGLIKFWDLGTEP